MKTYGSKIDEADLGWETKEVTYRILDLKLAGITGVISQSAIARYYEHQNPELIIKKVQSFHMNQADQTVILKVKVAKKPPMRTINHTPKGSSDPIPVANSEILTNRERFSPFPTPEPITDSARLLNAGPVIEAADHDVIDGKDARITELEGHLKRIAENPTGLHSEITLGTASLPMIWVPEKEVLAEYAERDRKITQLEKENAILKSAIKKFGNGNDFDWNVLGRIELLEKFIEEHDGHDSDCEIHDAGSPRTGYCSCGYAKEKEAILKVGEQKNEGDNNGRRP